jgi:hypothetical protein
LFGDDRLHHEQQKSAGEHRGDEIKHAADLCNSENQGRASPKKTTPCQQTRGGYFGSNIGYQAQEDIQAR